MSCLKWLRFVASGFAATLDMVLGIAIVHFSAYAWSCDLGFFHYALGVVLGVVPDFDIIHTMLAERKQSLVDHHDFLTHRPAVMVPIAALAGYVFGGQFWAFVFAGILFVHYLHDTRGLSGGGIAWLWPLDSRHIGVSRLGIIITEPREASALWPNHNAWLDNEYLTPSRRSLVELSFSSILLSIVFWQALGIYYAIAAVFIAWSLAGFLWSGYGLIRAFGEETEGFEAI